MSPDQQRESIERAARGDDIEIPEGHWYEDINVSGAKTSRKRFDAMLQAIERGEVHGCIVAKTSRLSRAAINETYALIERIEQAGGQWIAANLAGVDTSTPMGEFVMNMNFSADRLMWRMAAEDMADAKRRAAERGKRIGKAPLGYQSRDDGKIEPNGFAPIITEVYRLAAAEDYRAALRYLQAADPTRRWSPQRMKRMLSYRAYLGTASWDKITVEGAHEPLTDLATWTRAQGVPTKVHQPRSTYPLSGGPLHCGTCGLDMVGTKSGGSRRYVCGTSGTRRDVPGCAHLARVHADDIEEYVRALLVIEAETREMLPEDHPGILPDTKPANNDVGEAERALASAKLRRDEFAAADLDVSPEAWTVRARVLDEAVETAETAFAEALAAARPARVTPVSEEIRGAPVAKLPEFLERLGLVVRVTAGREPLTERVELVPEAPPPQSQP